MAPVLLWLALASLSFSGVVDEILKFNPFSKDRTYIPEKSEAANGSSPQKGQEVRFPTEIKVGGFIKKGDKRYLLVYEEVSGRFKVVKEGDLWQGFKVVKIEGGEVLLQAKGRERRVSLKYIKADSRKGKLPPVPPPPSKVRPK